MKTISFDVVIVTLTMIFVVFAVIMSICLMASYTRTVFSGVSIVRTKTNAVIQSVVCLYAAGIGTIIAYKTAGDQFGAGGTMLGQSLMAHLVALGIVLVLSVVVWAIQKIKQRINSWG